MIYSLIPDSPWYLTFPISFRHPLPQLFHSTFGNLGTFGMELSAIIQIALILCGVTALIKKLDFNNVRLMTLSFMVLASPCLLWGRQIGSDALGYAFMLLAMANIDNARKLTGYATMAVLCRHQYVFLMMALLLNRENWICFPLCALVFGLLVLSCRVPSGNLSAMYVSCVDWDKKPDGMSHFSYFNYYCGGNRGKVPLISLDCEAKSPYWKHKAKFLKLWGSSIYDNFRFSQMAFLLLLLLSAVVMVKRIVILNCLHYAVVVFSSSLYFQQYTLMIELTIIAATIKLYDHLGFKNEPA